MLRGVSAILILALGACAAGRAAAAGNPRETPVVLAVRKASPAVVNVATEVVVQGGGLRPGFNPLFEDFFRDFFRDLPRPERREQSLGSGVIIRADGTILTNQHVIANASRIVVTRATGEAYEARLVGADSRTDLAVLKVDVEGELPHLDMGTAEDLMIGETVIAIGNPFGLSHTVSTGVVSALNRTVRGRNDQVYTDFVQTDAPINPGNSGGPLLNILGELVGINSAIYQSAEGIGFAIPVDKARRIVEDLITYGEVHRAWLGLHVQGLNPELARYFGLEDRTGVIVTRIFEDSPAAEAGLRRGDVILTMEGRTLEDRDDFLERLAGYTAGSRVRFQVHREGEEQEFLVVARDIPDTYLERLSESWLGLNLVPNSRDLARKYGLYTARGLLVTEVVPGSAAAQAGIEPRDVVRQINDSVVDDEDGYRKALLAASQRETVVVVVQRGRASYYVTLSP